MQPQQPYGPPPQSPEPPREYPPLQPHQAADYVPGNATQNPQQLQPLPTYPSAAPTNTKPSDYEFIVNPSRPTNSSKLLSGSSKLPIIIVGVLLLLLLGFGAFALFGNKPDANTQTYLSLSRQQADIVRLSALGANEASASNTVKNSALITNMTVATDSGKFTALLSRGGVKLDPKQIAAVQDAAATQKLDQAVSTNTFDVVYNQIMQAKITKYQQTLQTAYGLVSAEATKTLLSQSYEHAKLLDKQIGED